ncbi:hypothetical protein BJ138DRAFT_311220 [Hygrophoropsis aurantiaca]|uniref:Uncharacterized protein n=1 Tax=Hygrophoropsis aurantiaca TaxID=72124 RepID=A0ACB8A5M8_9AGAM|nr:hypothetical protein BJ138DRAFT_311220 [Hygrophoropsis aurantiaca]
MSSEFPSQLHRNIPTTNGAFKRSFEQFGYDSDSSVSGDHNTEASGSSHGTRNATGGSSSTGNDRNKRARSTSSSSSSDDSSTDTSRSTEYDTAESSASLSEGSHSDLDVSPSLNPMATICPPIPNIPTSSASAISQLSSFPETEHHDEMLVDPLVPQNVAHEVTPHLHAPASATPDSLRRSIDRFNEFESEIAALRRSHSNTPTWLPSPPSFPETSLPMDSLNSVSVAEWTTPWLPDPPLQTLNTHRAEYYSGLGVASSRHEDAIPVQISGEDVTSVPEPIVITHSAAQAPDDDSPLNIPPYPPYPSYRPSHRSTSVSESRVSIPPALQPESFISSSSGSRSSDWSATSHSHEAERSPGRESRSPSWWNRIHSRRRSSPAESRVVTSPLPSSESTFSSEPTSTSTSSSRRTSTSMGTPERSRRRIPLSTSIFRSPEPSRPSSPTNDSSDYIMSLFGRRPASRTEPRREQSPWDTEIVERRARPRIEYSRERRFSQVPPAETQGKWLSSIARW